MPATDSRNTKTQTTSIRDAHSTTLAELADLVGGRLEGDGSLIISGAEIISRACQGEITLADHPKLVQQLAQSQASATLISANIDYRDMPTIRVENVRPAFAQIVSHLYPQAKRIRTGISSGAWVSPLAQLDNDVDIHLGAAIDQHVVIGRGSTIHGGVRIMDGCVIGEDVTIFPNSVLYPQTHIGDRSILHAGAVIGGYGFGYQLQDGNHQHNAQLGYVVIGKRVEIGVNTTIDRGTYGATSIGDGTKIDNQVQIGHNCQIGKHNLICSQVGIAGSVSTGDYVVIAGQVGFVDHVLIGNHVTIGAKSAIMNNVEDGLTVLGYPATPVREQKLKQVAWSKLPEMRKQFRIMQRQITQLEEQLGQHSSNSQTDDQAA